MLLEKENKTLPVILGVMFFGVLILVGLMIIDDYEADCGVLFNTCKNDTNENFLSTKSQSTSSNYKNDCIELSQVNTDIIAEACMIYMNANPGSTGSEVVEALTANKDTNVLDGVLLP